MVKNTSKWLLPFKKLNIFFNFFSAHATKLSNTLKQFVSNSQQIVWVCLTI